ncbi:GGDEF domain-containing protein [Vibrio paucivorans]
MKPRLQVLQSPDSDLLMRVNLNGVVIDASGHRAEQMFGRNVSDRRYAIRAFETGRSYQLQLDQAKQTADIVIADRIEKSGKVQGLLIRKINILYLIKYIHVNDSAVLFVDERGVGISNLRMDQLRVFRLVGDGPSWNYKPTKESLDLLPDVITRTEIEGFTIFKANIFPNQLFLAQSMPLPNGGEIIAVRSAKNALDQIRSLRRNAIVKGALFAFLVLALYWLLYSHLKIRWLVNIDPLTGAYNRARFDTDFGEFCQINAKNERQCYLLLLDIDHFKYVNDRFGHLVGDEVLKAVASTIRQNYNVEALYRYGGEEFAILLHSLNRAEALRVAEQIRNDIELQASRHHMVTVSGGVATLRYMELSHQLFKRADDLLYRAKRQGRNRIELDDDRNNLDQLHWVTES